MTDDANEYRYKALVIALRAVWERWQRVRQDISEHVIAERFLGAYYPETAIKDEHADRYIHFLREGGITVEQLTNYDLDVMMKCHSVISNWINSDDEKMRNGLISSMNEIQRGISKANPSKVGNDREEDRLYTLAALGIKTFAKELGITIPNQAAGAGRAIED